MRIMKVYFDRTFTLNDKGMTTAFTYDLIDQLLTEVRNGYEAEYTYDANGNRLTRTVNNVTEVYEYDDADKLLNVKINNTPVKEYTYDDCGRLIEVESSAGTTYLSWDIRNRLTQITYPNSSTNTFGYNGFGSRISKSDSTGNYTFLRNGTGITAPVLADSYAEYTPGISERRNSNSTYYHSDLKNTTAQTNSSQNISGTNDYDAFGNLIDYTGNWNGPFGFGGKFGYQSDDDSGLLLLGHRYYDTSTGRFISRDPLQNGNNWFNYCGANPLTNVDPDGQTTVSITIALLYINDKPQKQANRALIVYGQFEIIESLYAFVWRNSVSKAAVKEAEKKYGKENVDILGPSSVEDFLEKATHADFIYFHGHGADGILVLTSREAIVPHTDLPKLEKRRKQHGYKKMTAVFLDTCEGLLGAEYWRGITKKLGGHYGGTGFIGHISGQFPELIIFPDF